MVFEIQAVKVSKIPKNVKKTFSPIFLIFVFQDNTEIFRVVLGHIIHHIHAKFQSNRAQFVASSGEKVAKKGDFFRFEL